MRSWEIVSLSGLTYLPRPGDDLADGARGVGNVQDPGSGADA